MKIKWSSLYYFSTTTTQLIKNQRGSSIRVGHNNINHNNSIIAHRLKSRDSIRGIYSSRDSSSKKMTTSKNVEEKSEEITRTNTSATASMSTGTFSFSSTSLPWVNSLKTTGENNGDNTNDSFNHSNIIKKQTSIFSWNILAQHLFDNTQHWYEHVRKSPNNEIVYKWNLRWPAIRKEMQQSDSDIICLQEVEFTAFDNDILPYMNEIGYDGIMQQVKGKKNGHGFGVATFWKKGRFTMQNVSHHSRTMLTTLEEKGVVGAGEVIAIINCHLEGDPAKSVTRVRQLYKSLKEIKNKYTHHHLIVCGDFNCQLGQSACSTYLHQGSCPKHIPIVEFGHELSKDHIEELDKVIGEHEYNFRSAYPIELMTNDPFEYITFVNTPGSFTAGLDQIWYHSDLHACTLSDKVVGLRHPFHSTEHRNQVLQYGLPSKYNPSDHMPVGCILEWGIDNNNQRKDLYESHQELQMPTQKQKRVRGFKKQENEEINKEDLSKQIKELLDACPFASKEHRSEFEFVISPVEGVKAGQKPPPHKILEIQQRREAKKKLWNVIEDDVKQFMERIIVLAKKLTQLNK